MANANLARPLGQVSLTSLRECSLRQGPKRRADAYRRATKAETRATTTRTKIRNRHWSTPAPSVAVNLRRKPSLRTFAHSNEGAAEGATGFAHTSIGQRAACLLLRHSPRTAIRRQRSATRLSWIPTHRAPRDRQGAAVADLACQSDFGRTPAAPQRRAVRGGRWSRFWRSLVLLIPAGLLSVS